jgi:hypothetical protein
MLNPIIYHLILASICGYALWRGRFDERFTAIVCLLATLATRLALSPTAQRYSSLEVGVLIVDSITFLAFVYVALRSDRFWPLWVSGLQLTTTLAHFMKAIDASLFPQAYAAAGRFWGYPILLILAIGAHRTSVRSKKASAISA